MEHLETQNSLITTQNTIVDSIDTDNNENTDWIMIATAYRGCRDTNLISWESTWQDFIEKLKYPEIGDKDGSYFTRTTGTKRDDLSLSDTAYLLILDGDSSINKDGQVVRGAPHPQEVHEVLKRLDLTHFIYTSHSNDIDNYRYRVVLPCVYTKDELSCLINYLINKLYEYGVMLANVQENSVWSQPWYFPRVQDEAREQLFEFYEFAGKWLDVKDAEAHLSTYQEPEPIQIESHGTDEIETIASFNQAHTCKEILERNGYESNELGGQYQRWMHPNSQSGEYGVQLCMNCKDSIERIYSHNSNDPLCDRHAHDAFDIYRILECEGNWHKAFQRDKQFNYVKTRNTNLSFNLNQFVLNGKSEQMEKQMLEDKFILEGIAILGQSTIFYAKPNSGKTLLTISLLVRGIKRGQINSRDVYYINADDNHKGLTQKLKIAEEHGFYMLAPGHNQFKIDELSRILQSLIDSDLARGKVIILDTVKKFVDLMRKDKTSNFSQTIRQFVSKGGSIIMLAHVNKHKDHEGKLIYGGTSDLVDDSDCAYTLDIISEDSLTHTRVVKFENIKNRGAVVNEAYYQYDATPSTSYLAKLESIKVISENEKHEIQERKAFVERKETNADAIEAIKEVLLEGDKKKTQLIQEASKRSGISKSKITKALNDHAGESIQKHQYWKLIIEERNAHIYQLN